MSSHHHGEDEHVLEHVVGVGTYLGIFGALMVLTAATVGAAFIDLGHILGGGEAPNIVVMLLIAFAKATLVLLYFMHLKFSSRLSQAWAVAAVLWLGIMIVITMSDYLSRGIFS